MGFGEGRGNLSSERFPLPSPIFLPVQRRLEGVGQGFDGYGEQGAVGGGHGQAGVGGHFPDEGRGGTEMRFKLGGLVGRDGDEETARGFAVQGFRQAERPHDGNAVQGQMRAETAADAHFGKRHGEAVR